MARADHSCLKLLVCHSVFHMDLSNLFLTLERGQRKWAFIWEVHLVGLGTERPWRSRGSTPPNSLKSKVRHCSFPGLLEQLPAEEGACCALSNPFVRVQSCHGCNYIIRGENNSWRPNNDLFFKVTEPFHQNKAGVDNECSSLCVFTMGIAKYITRQSTRSSGLG